MAAAALLALGVAACGSTVSTSSFKGEQKAVAQALADFQSHSSTGEVAKICADDVAAELLNPAKPAQTAETTKQGKQAQGKQAKPAQGEQQPKATGPTLGGKSACEKAFKRQLGQTDNFELTVESVKITGAKTATAQVKSTYSGKKKTSEIKLVKEGGDWRIARL